MLEYFFESGMNRYRVWCKGWPGDTFVLMTPIRFKLLCDFASEFSEVINLVETHDVEEVRS
jgi:hypothetical protein